MGNKQVIINPSQSPQQIVDKLLSSTHEPTFAQISPSIQHFLINLRHQLPSQNNTMKTLVCQTMVRIFHHQFFRDKMLSLCKLLFKQLQYMINKKAMILISGEQWQYASLLADFIIVFTDDRMRFLYDSIQQRNDIDQNIKKLATNQNNIPNILEDIPTTQKEQFCQILRDILFYSFRMKDYLITRSPKTQIYVDDLLKSLFLLYTKLYLASRQQFRLKFTSQHEKQNLFIICNAIGMGLEYKQQVVVDLANLFLQNLMKFSQLTLLKLAPLPSHFYPHIPIFHCQNLYDSIVTLNLYALTEIKKQKVNENEQKYAHFFKINRIQALKNSILLIKNFKPNNSEVSYFMNFLIARIDVLKIQKYYTYKLAKIYKNNFGMTPALQKYFNAVTSQKQGISNLQQNTNDNLVVRPKDYKLAEQSQQIITQIDTVINDPQPLFQALSQKFIYEKICQLPSKSDQSEKYLNFIISQKNHKNRKVDRMIEEPEQKAIKQQQVQIFQDEHSEDMIKKKCQVMVEQMQNE